MLMLGLYDGPDGAMLLDCTPYLMGAISIGNDRHGFESLSATVEQRLIAAFRVYARTALAWARLWWNGQIVWEGRVEDPSAWAGTGSGLRFTAFGAWRALSDIPYTALWSMSSVAQFRPTRSDEVSGRNTELYDFDTNNRVRIALKGGATYANINDSGGMIYQKPDGGSRQIIGVMFDAVVTLPTNWRLQINQWSTAYASVAATVVVTGGGGVTTINRFYTFSGCDYLEFVVYNNTGGVYTNTNQTGLYKALITNVRLVTTTTNKVDTTMTSAVVAGSNVSVPVGSTANMYVGQRLHLGAAAGLGEGVIVESIPDATHFVADLTASYASGQNVQAFVIYADEIMNDMVSTAAANGQLSSATTQIQSPAVDLFDESYEDQSMAAVADRLALLGDNQSPPRQWEAAVWDAQRLVFRPRGTAARSWFVDVSALQAERSIESYANSVYAIYQNANNRTLRTAIASNATAIAAAGFTRQQAISASTTSDVQAGIQRDAFLDDHDDLKARSTIAFDRLFNAGGASRQLWEPRAGDTLTIRNLLPASGSAVDDIRTITIGRARLDVNSRALTIEPDPPPPALSALLARLAANIK